jgi:RNA polymerase sigma-70 factor (ECF subfamily)
MPAPADDLATFRALMQRLRGGDEAAAVELVRRFEPAIRRAARVRLGDAGLQRLFDSVDVCQSVLGNFFVRAALGQFDLESPTQLLKLLVSMCRNKVIDLAREAGAARRDFRRTQEGTVEDRHCAAPGPSPSEEVAARELLEEFQRRLTPEERDLADQRAAGRAWAQIAADRGVSPEALRKQFRRALDRVAAELGLRQAC